MTDIVVGVRLNADGSGLVGQLRLSKAEMDQLKAAEVGAAEAARDLSRATDDAGKAQTRNVTATKQASSASAELTRNVGLQRAGWQQVGFQVQDVFASYASGSRLSVIFAQQSGQLASAIALIAQSAEGGKGKLAGLASFLGGPWGIAIGIAVSAGSALAASLLDTGKAADAAKLGASGLSDAQSVLGEMFDLTSGKIKAQNGLLVLNARLMAINLRGEAAQEKASAQSTVQASDDRSFVGTASAFFARTRQNPFDRVRQVDDRAREARGYLDAVSNAKDDAERRKAGQRALKFSETADFSALSITAEEFRQAVVDQASSVAKVAIADAIDKSLDSGSLDPSLRREDRRKPKKDTSAEKAAREVKQLADFSDRAAEAVARLSGEFDTAPRDIDRAAQATRSIDALVKDINERLATSKNLTADQRAEFNKIKDDAEKLKPVIQASLIRPFTDMLDVQQRQIDLGKLQVAGRQSDAEALQLTYSLMDKMGVETEDQLATELAKRGVTEDQVRSLYDNLDVLRQQTREMRVQQQVQQMFLNAVGDMRENVRLTLQDLRQDGPKALGDFAKRSVDVFDRLFSEVATEKLFGGLFRDLEDQITGGDKVSDAGKRMAAAVDRAAVDLKKTSKDILALGDAAALTTAKLKGESAPVADAIGAVVPSAGAPSQEPADIVVTALKSNFRTGFEGVFDDLNKGLKGLFTDIFGDRGLFSTSLAKTLGQVAGNAALGGTAGSLATGLLGIKGSGTGGMLGGAIGGAIGKEVLGSLGSFAGPLGAIAGGVLGSVVGGLFKKSKTGSATIGNVDGEGAVTGTSGNSAEYRKQSAGMAGNVLNSLDQIVQQLGGTLGNFAVSVGYKKSSEPYRVDTSGQGRTKGSGVLYFTDEAEAQAAALANAIADGAVGGVSEAVRRALASSDDVSKAVQEALKVQDVETLLGGLTSAFASHFKAFEAQAKERLRIATQYGFDVVAIEKKNAEDRAKLVDQILTDRVGSLQSLLEDLKFGDLAEGSAMDQRASIIAEIAKARSGAEAGEDGAADRLAGLSRSLVEFSRDNLGTAGSEYASDRKTATDAAEAVIKAENERIKAAQNEQAATNTKLDQANSLSSQQVDYLSSIDQSLKTLAVNNGAPAAGGGSAMLTDWYRTQQL